MDAFNVGDKVVINGGTVATLLCYDEANNIVVYVHEVNGGTNTVTAPISHTRIVSLADALTSAAVGFSGVIDVGGTHADALGGLE